MQFIDEATITVKAGDGGNGACSFRREKFVPRGGPDGGDGGDGGNVLVQATTRLTTLLDLRYQKHYEAEKGEGGGGSNCHGRRGVDVSIPVPVGTMVFDVNTQVSKLVYAYDWRALKLNPNDQQTAETQTANMLLFGRYTPVKVAGEQMQVFQVTRANMRVAMGVSDAPETDRYYSAKAGDPSCASPPCQNLTAQRLNQPKTQPEQWSGVDFSRLSLSQPGTAQLWNELAAGKAYVSVPPGNNKETTILIGQAFRPLQAGPLN